VTHDELFLLALLLSFAGLVTAHVALVFGLALRAPRWRAIPALALAPLAPYWGARAGMHARVVLWVTSALAYVSLRLLLR
jgi:hypothetical protein